MFEQAFKNIDDVLRKEAGCTTELDVATIDQTTFDLNAGEEATHRSPEEILDEIAALDVESAEVLQTIRGLL